MLLSMEYGNFKPHEADAFELDHVIAYLGRHHLKWYAEQIEAQE